VRRQKIRKNAATHISKNSPSDSSKAHAIAYTVLIEVFKMPWANAADLGD